MAMAMRMERQQHQQQAARHTHPHSGDHSQAARLQQHSGDHSPTAEDPTHQAAKAKNARKYMARGAVSSVQVVSSSADDNSLPRKNPNKIVGFSDASEKRGSALDEVSDLCCFCMPAHWVITCLQWAVGKKIPSPRRSRRRADC